MATTYKTPRYPFTEEELAKAAREWGCNCGPSALAFALQVPLDTVRRAIPEFDTRRYTSPSMMKAALAHLGAKWSNTRILNRRFTHAEDRISLVRIQWTGPWTAAGVNPKWAYRQTHWITTFEAYGAPCVFDCNGGMRTADAWKKEIIPFIVKHVPRADGNWFPTHIWSIQHAIAPPSASKCESCLSQGDRANGRACAECEDWYCARCDGGMFCSGCGKCVDCCECSRKTEK